jgi:hypothetical protein
MKESSPLESSPDNKTPNKTGGDITPQGMTRRLFVTGMASMAIATRLESQEGVQSEPRQSESRPKPEFSQGFEVDPNLPPVPLETKKVLERFLSEKEAKLSFLRTALVIALPTQVIENPAWVNGLDRPIVVDVLKSTPVANLRFALGMSRLIQLQKEPRITKGREPSEELIEGMPVEERFVDQYGNEVIIHRGKPTLSIFDLMQRMLGRKPISDSDSFDPNRVIEEKTIIIPPLPLINGSKGTDKPIPFNFQSPLGKNEKVEGLLYLLPETPVFAIDGYNVYGDIEQFGNAQDVEKKYGSNLRELIKGLQGVDQLFGGERKFVKNIVLVEYGKADKRMHIENAYVERSTPKTVSVFTDILFRSAGRHDITGFHEAVHSIDLQLGISNHPHFRILFSQLSKEFFDKVKETEFLKIPGGHPGDNHFEFLASLINSFNHSDWENKASSMDSNFLMDYLSSFVTLQDILKECGQAIPSGAAIFNLLEKRILFLKKILGVENKQERLRHTKN